MRPALTILGLIGIVVGMAMAHAVDSGLPPHWSSTARSVWVIAAIAIMFAGVTAMLVGVGAISSATLREIGEPTSRAPSVAQFIGVYAVTIFSGAALAILLEDKFGIDSDHGVALVGGTLFLLSAVAKPTLLFAVFRRVGWFAAIGSDRNMRWVLVCLGSAMLLYGLTAVL